MSDRMFEIERHLAITGNCCCADVRWLIAEVRRLRADEARMNWLERHRVTIKGEYWDGSIDASRKPIREVIDGFLLNP